MLQPVHRLRTMPLGYISRVSSKVFIQYSTNAPSLAPEYEFFRRLASEDNMDSFLRKISKAKTIRGSMKRRPQRTISVLLHSVTSDSHRTQDVGALPELTLALSERGLQDNTAYHNASRLMLKHFPAPLPYPPQRMYMYLTQLGRLASAKSILIDALARFMAYGPQRQFFDRSSLVSIVTAIGRAERLAPQEIATMVWVCAVLQVHNEPLLASLTKQLLHKSFLRRAQASEVLCVARHLPQLSSATGEVVGQLALRALHSDVRLHLSPNDLATIARACAATHCRNAEVLIDLAQCLLSMPSLSVGDAGDMLIALNTSQVRCEELTQFLVSHVDGAVEGFQTSHLVHLLWAMAQTTATTETSATTAPPLSCAMAILNVICGSQRLDSLTASDAPWLLEALAVLGEAAAPTGLPLAVACAERAQCHGWLSEMTDTDVSTIVQCLAKVGATPEAFLLAAADRFQPIVQTLPIDELASLVCAFAHLDVRPTAFLQITAERVAAAGSPVGDDAISLLRIGWALAKLGFVTDGAVDAMALHVFRKVLLNDRDVDRSTVVMALWTLAAVGHRHGLLLQKFASQIVANGWLDDCDDGEIATVARSFATLGVRNGSLLNAIADTVSKRLPGVDVDCLAAVLETFASCGVRKEPFLSAVAAAVLQSDRAAPPRTIAAVAWSCASLDIARPALRSHLMRIVDESTSALLDSRDRLRLAWAMAACGITTGSFPLLLGAALETLGSLNPPLQALAQQVVAHVLLHHNALPADFVAQATQALPEMAAWDTPPRTHAVDQFHSTVGRHLRKLGLTARAAAGLPDAGGYVVDFALEGDRRVVVQLLDSSRCLRCNDGEGWQPTGAEQLKEEHLKGFGYSVVSVPFYHWRVCGTGEEERLLLRRLLAPALDRGTPDRPALLCP